MSSTNNFLEFCHYSRSDLKFEIGIDSYMNQICECSGKVGEHDDDKLDNKRCSFPDCKCKFTKHELGSINY